MAENAANDTSTATPNPSPARTSPADVDKRSLADIKLGEDVYEAAVLPGRAELLAAEGITERELAQLATLCRRARDTGNRVVEVKKAKKEATAAEAAAQKELLAGLRDLQKRAQRKFPKDQTKLAAYRVGKENFGRNRTELEQDAEVLLQLATDDALPGLTPEKLQAGRTCLADWKKADEQQDQAIAKQTQVLGDFASLLAKVNAARRDIQLAADTIWPYTLAENRPLRRAFALSPTRPAKGA